MTVAARAWGTFASTFGAEPAALASAPGRINLIGEHTDYNDGWVLPAAIDRRTWVAAARCPSDLATVQAVDLRRQVTFRLTELESRNDVHGQPLPDWARYPAGVAWALQQAGASPVGIDAVVTSDVPIGAGLSSSAAFEVALALAWMGLSGIEIDRSTLARLCQRAENDYVGVKSGLMDPFTSLHARAGHALLLDCRSLKAEPLPLPKNLAVVVADSGVRHALGASAYNTRREECAEAARRLGEILPGVTSLRDVSDEQLVRVEAALPAALGKRAKHVVHENARVLAAIERLRNQDAPGLGAILLEGHASLRDLFEVSHPDVDTLVELAQGMPGCFGARLMGGGFGGSTVNLVEAGLAEGFSEEIVRQYRRATGRVGQAWVCTTGGAAEVSLPSP
jgi:galactokinase